MATDIHRHFEGMHAVDGVSIEVLPGHITGLIGPNGAGKSTLLAVLAGTLPASQGTIIFDGEDITQLPAYKRARRGMVRTFQLPSEFAQLTVLENLLVAAPKNRGDSLVGAMLGKRYWRGDEAGAGRARPRAARPLQHERQGVRLRGLPERRPEAARRDHARADAASPGCCCSTSRCPACTRRSSGRSPRYCEALRDEGLTIVMVEHELHMIERHVRPGHRHGPGHG